MEAVDRYIEEMARAPAVATEHPTPYRALPLGLAAVGGLWLYRIAFKSGGSRGGGGLSEQPETAEERSERRKAVAVGMVKHTVLQVAQLPVQNALLRVQLRRELLSLGLADEGGPTNVLSMLLDMAREEGLTGLFQGLPWVAAGAVPGVMLTHAIKASLRPLLPKPKKSKGYLKWLLSHAVEGALGAAISLAITLPFENIRVRVAVEGDAGLFDGMAYHGASVRGDGFKRSYTSYAVSLAGVVVARLAYFVAYDLIVQAQDQVDGGKDETFAARARATLVSLISQAVAYPFDTIRLRLAVNPDGVADGGYDSGLQCAATVVRDEGLAGLYAGLDSRVAIEGLRNLFSYAVAAFAASR